MTAVEIVEAEDAPNLFVRVTDNGEEVAMIPWGDARLIYAAVKEHKEQNDGDAE